MMLAAAMAVQNEVHRVFFPKSPPTTLMTGSPAQIMMDIGDLLRGELQPETRATTWERCTRLMRSVCIFALGCGVSALIDGHLGTWAWRYSSLHP
jgi:uncharacterized membrane protein YoaK (UPF0700 family)